MRFSAMVLIVLLIGLSSGAYAQGDAPDCNIMDIREKLANVQSAQKDGNLETAIELLDTLLVDLDTLMENCTVEPDVTLEAVATEVDEVDDEQSDLTAPKGDGFYLVGIDIAPGRWESTGEDTGCYWQREDREGDIRDNHYGNAGGTVTILDDDFQIEFNDCGTFEYVEDRVPELEETALDPKGDGFYTVGIEIVPGLWRSTGTGDGCFYARLDAFQETIANHYGNSGVTVIIDSGDYEVAFQDCGNWEYLGE